MSSPENIAYTRENFVGMNIADFSRKFPDRSSWRIASFNGHASQPAGDSNPKRVNLHLKAGVITKVTWG